MLAEPVALLFKHSTTCWMSEMAEKTVRHFKRDTPDIPVYVIDVRFQRNLSRQLADDLGIPHESPQAILLRNGKPVWDASHLQITLDRITAAAA